MIIVGDSMKSKGFTLIELLAVIVILAVVSLIAIPLITNVIETSKKGAIKDSAYGIIESANVYVANNLKDGLKSNIKFTCENNKCVGENNEQINYKGKIESGTLIITSNDKVLVCVDDGEYYALKLENEEKVTNGEGTCGEYEEANGTFEIISDIDALKAQYEAEILDLKEQNKALEDQLQEKYDEGFEAGQNSGTSYVAYTTGTLKLPDNWKKIYVRYNYQLSEGALIERQESGKSSTSSLRWGDSGGTSNSNKLTFYVNFDTNEVVVTGRHSGMNVMVIVLC